jgi:hypothetical protein
VNLPEGHWFLMRPCVRGVYRMESLLDGTLSLEHVAMANDALDMADENERRMHEAVQRQQEMNRR